MSTIVYRTNPVTGIVYAYESTSYRDPVSKRPRSRQVYLGRVNPEDNTIIPKGTESKRNRGATEKRLADLEQNIAEMRDELEQSKAEIARLKETIRIDDRLIGALKSAIRECEDQRAAITPANLFESKE